MTFKTSTYSEVKQTLDEMGYTEEDLNNMWTFLIGKAPIVTHLDRCGKDWKDLNLVCLKTLPRTYEKYKDVNND